MLLCALVGALVGCSAGGRVRSAEAGAAQNSGAHATQAAPNVQPAARNDVPVIHVFVALCDNAYQGIVPVPARLGDGDNPATNLYWGAAFGVKAFFTRHKDWQLVACTANPRAAILERCVFRHRRTGAYLVADAYRGREIKQTTIDFLEAASGTDGDTVAVEFNRQPVRLHTAGSARLVAYLGHDGLMDFQLPSFPQPKDDEQRAAVILACASKNFFARPLRATGAHPLLWTTNLMAPEAYVLAATLDGWLQQETAPRIRQRAAAAYHQYQHCGLKSANALFATGW